VHISKTILLIVSLSVISCASMGGTLSICKPEIVLDNKAKKYLKAISKPPKGSDISVWMGIYPQAMTLDLSDNIYISDQLNDQILILDPQGSMIRSIPLQTQLKRKGDFFPSLAVDSDGNIYIINQIKKSVQVYSREGEYLRSIPYTSSKLIAPNYIAIDYAGNIYIAIERDRVVVIDNEGRVIRKPVKLTSDNFYSIEPLKGHKLVLPNKLRTIKQLKFKPKFIEDTIKGFLSTYRIIDKSGVLCDFQLNGVIHEGNTGYLYTIDRLGNIYFMESENLDIYKIDFKKEKISISK